MKRLDDKAFLIFLVLLLIFPLALIFLCLDSNFVSDHYCSACGAFLGTEVKLEAASLELETSNLQNSQTEPKSAKSKKSQESPRNDRGEESGEL